MKPFKYHKSTLGLQNFLFLDLRVFEPPDGFAGLDFKNKFWVSGRRGLPTAYGGLNVAAQPPSRSPEEQKRGGKYKNQEFRSNGVANPDWPYRSVLLPRIALVEKFFHNRPRPQFFRSSGKIAGAIWDTQGR